MSDYGTLTDAATGEAIRPATREEWLRSVEDGTGGGAFVVDRDGDVCDASADPAVFGPLRRVYVVGGPESTRGQDLYQD